MGTRIKGNQIDYPIAAFDTPVIVGIDPTDGQAIYRVTIDLTARVISVGGGGTPGPFSASTGAFDMDLKSKVLKIDIEWEGAFPLDTQKGVNGICWGSTFPENRGAGQMLVHPTDPALDWAQFTRMHATFDYKD